MKRFLGALIVVVVALGSAVVMGQAPPVEKAAATPELKLETIKLSPPKLDKGLPLMQALSKRQTTRTIADTKLTAQQLSELLWAADGVNRASGERTAPSAMHKYPVDIYVVLGDGVYLYEVAQHDLRPVAAGDYRKQAGKQDFVYIAPVNLVYVADLDKLTNTRPTGPSVTDEQKMVWAAIEAGCQVENVYLYCASEGLGATIRGMIDGEAFGKIIHARPTQKVICAQTIGNPK